METWLRWYRGWWNTAKKSSDLDTIVSVEFDLLNELIDEDTNSALGEALW